MSEIYSPRLIVRGQSVTPEQAGEILLRTNAWWGFSFRDLDWGAALAETIGLELPEHAGRPSEASLAALCRRLRALPLTYLYTARIGTYFIGTRGWCDWDGRIEACSYDLVNYPSRTDLDADWCTIAAAFPYLRLDAQILHRGEVADQWVIGDGTVHRRAPGPLLLAPSQEPRPEERPGGPERSFPIAYLAAAVDRLESARRTRAADQTIPEPLPLAS